MIAAEGVDGLVVEVESGAEEQAENKTKDETTAAKKFAFKSGFMDFVLKIIYPAVCGWHRPVRRLVVFWLRVLFHFRAPSIRRSAERLAFPIEEHVF